MITKYYFTITKEYKWEITYPRIIDFINGDLTVSKRLPRLSIVRNTENEKDKWIDLVFNKHVSLLILFPKDLGERKYL